MLENIEFRRGSVASRKESNVRKSFLSSSGTNKERKIDWRSDSKCSVLAIADVSDIANTRHRNSLLAHLKYQYHKTDRETLRGIADEDPFVRSNDNRRDSFLRTNGRRAE